MSSQTAAFPRPGKALLSVMLAVLAIWLMFAIAVNWGGADIELFLLFCGNTQRLLDGEVWRLITAPWMHLPQGDIGHVLFVLIGLYFLTPTLESHWGGARLLRFLFFSGLIAYGLQAALQVVLPDSISAKLVNTGIEDESGAYWFGGFPVVEAVAIAWALSFKGQVVRLFFVLPVTSRGLIGFVVGISLLKVIATSRAPEGLLSPFGGMLAGWLLGGGTPSPLRRVYLGWRLSRLDREASRARGASHARAREVGLKVLKGGQDGPSKTRGKGPDGKWLN